MQGSIWDNDSFSGQSRAEQSLAADLAFFFVLNLVSLLCQRDEECMLYN